ncbi:unnamed protein product [Ostreobium quekettii]|uniref:ABC transporter domain-containing protein n=1 Tax=Ostreobium quekettii TaxID=121088 RepID=A0A8S1IRL5_9CHLO|nr:unnamed protein product [Ostreobium quekettii]
MGPGGVVSGSVADATVCAAQALPTGAHASKSPRFAGAAAAGASTAESAEAKGEGLVKDFGQDQRLNGVGNEVSAASVPGSQEQEQALELEVKGLKKLFKTKKGIFTALDGVDIKIKPKSTVALLGPSGSGKTTLLRIISGLEEPTEGAVYFDGVDVTSVPVQDRNLGFVFQSYAMFKHMSIADNISFGLRIRKKDVDIDKRVEELLELVELPGIGNRYPSQLSGGQRQRIALARALANSPRLLLLDEPFGALDVMVRKNLRAGLKKIISRLGITTLFVTHDKDEAFDLADEVAIFHRGSIAQSGASEDVKRDPLSPFVLNFIHDVNKVPANCQLLRRMKYSTHKSMAMFQPKDMVVHTDMNAPGPLAPATVAERYNIGFMVKYSVKFDDGVEVELHASREDSNEGGSLDFDVGQRVYVFVDPNVFMDFEPEELDATPGATQ